MSFIYDKHYNGANNHLYKNKMICYNIHESFEQ